MGGGGATAFGGEGGDAITVTNGFPEGMSVDIDGGDGSDTLTGNASGEDLYSGNSGNDVMHGGAGSDALISEGTGADQLYGESGNDQLVTNNPCEGVLFSGGEDTDIAGFARTVPGENGAPANGGVNGIDAWLGEMDRDGLDAILTTASGCGTVMKDYGFMLRGDPDYAGKIAAVAHKVNGALASVSSEASLKLSAALPITAKTGTL